MSRSDLERLRDARDFAQYALATHTACRRTFWPNARQPQHAALFDLVIMGETLNKVSAEVQKAAPDLPWRQIVDMRQYHRSFLLDD